MEESICNCGMTFEQWRELVIVSTGCIGLLIAVVLIGGGLMISCMHRRKEDV